jgi:MYXO-CTERM domain-containing protein
MKIRLPLVLATLLTAAPVPASLVAWYPLDEGSGAVANDASGNGNFMAASSTAWLGTGAFGGSFQLSAGNTLLARTGTAGSLAGINATTGNKVTLMMWLKPNSENIGGSPFWISDSNVAAGNRLFQAHLEWVDGTTYWDSSWGDGTDQRASGDLGIVSDVLHHFAFTYNGDTGLTEVYKDGTALISATTATQVTLPWASILNMEFGAASFSSWWPGGQIDDLAIFNESLSPAQINLARLNGVVALVPEPAGVALAGLAGLFLLRRRR